MFRACRARLVALLFMLAPTVLGQSSLTGALGGTVGDPNKHLVSQAKVTVRNQGTDAESTTTTDDEGRFRIGSLQPGTYFIKITANGFSSFENERHAS